MKNLIKNIGIRGKLSLLTALYVLGMSIFGGVAYSTLSKVKVNGPLYTEIVKGKDLVADILPPPMYIIESYLITHQIADEENPAELERLTKKAKTLHDEYNTRYEVWKKELPEGKLKTALLEKAHDAATEFYAVQEGEFTQAMLKDDHEAARNLAGGKLKKLFETQRDAIAEVVNLATEHNTATEASANTSIATGTWMLIAICIGLAVGLTTIALWIAAGIIRIVNQNVASMEAATKQDYSLRPTIQAGGELGRMNVALNSMLDSLTEFEASAADYKSQVAAVDRANAVIEFELDGTIIRANDNFIKTMGYSQDEIVGRHHRMFVEPTEAASNEYRQFWDDLRAGKPSSGEFHRYGKGNREVWVQGIYNPIMDADGKVQRVIKYVIDITENKRLELEGKRKAEREQAAAAEQARKVDQLLRVVNGMADGDFAQAVPDMGDDSVGQVAQAVNKAMDSVRDALHQVREVALTVGSSSAELASASEEIASGAQEQASSLEETAASLEEITSAVKQNTDNAQQAQQLAHTSRQTAEVGGTVVGDAVNAMTAINDASKKIAEIITTIDEIAFQTNLLALNAAVEAARAGEQGRGFAVVASEVRSLAQRSASAAREIKNLIQDSVSKVQNGTALVNKSGDTLKEIVNSVKRVADIVTEISSASTEQLTGIEQVNNAVSQMDRVTQTNAAQTEEMSSTSQNLLSHAEHLQQLVARFRLGSDDGAGVVATPIQTKKPARSSSPKKTKSTPIAPVSTGGAHELDMIGLPGGDFGQAPGTFVEF